jgi:CBS domain containing-hemolysin-like protein
MILALHPLADWILWAALACVGLACSALYSGTETGIYVLNKMRLDLRAEAGSLAARALRRMLRNFDALLAVLLIGNNLVNYLTTFSISVLFVMGGAGDRAEWYTLAAAASLLFVFGESVPKNLFQRSPERLVYRLVWFLKASSAAFRWCGLLGLVRLVGRAVSKAKSSHHPFAHEGLAAILAEGLSSGALTHAQSIMADRVMHLTDVTVDAVMKPMKGVLKAPRNVTRQRLLELVREANYTRLPMLEADGSVAGILDIYDVLMAAEPVEPASVMAPPLVVPGRWTVTDALYHMQTSHAPMAIVADAHGRHVGMVTVKDLVEQIVGELGAW